MKETTGWKNLNPDMTCNGFKFEVGKWHKHYGSIRLCSSGFHFHVNSSDLFSYYKFDLGETIVAEVVARGDVINGDDKSVCSEIKIKKILTNDEVRSLGNLRNNYGWGNTGYRNTGNRNTGYINTGDRNTGDENTGYRNTGYRNTGNRNTGYRNTGDWNKCNNSNGFFNTKSPEYILVFNSVCKRTNWDNAEKPRFIYFNNNWGDIVRDITKTDISLLKKLPNFNEGVFKEISGFSVKDLEYYEILFRNF